VRFGERIAYQPGLPSAVRARRISHTSTLTKTVVAWTTLDFEPRARSGGVWVGVDVDDLCGAVFEW
jgi:hypothetical protein